MLEPADAAGCNVLELVPLKAAPLPPQLPAAARAVGGMVSISMALHIPGCEHGGTQVLICGGGVVSELAVTWTCRRRAWLSPQAASALKAALELGTPLTLEVCRTLTTTAGGEQLPDPAWCAYHAVLRMETAAEQLCEPGAVDAEGEAFALGCTSWALQTGALVAPGLVAAAPASAG